jgi:hypothetical protein
VAAVQKFGLREQKLHNGKITQWKYDGKEAYCKHSRRNQYPCATLGRVLITKQKAQSKKRKAKSAKQTNSAWINQAR